MGAGGIVTLSFLSKEVYNSFDFSSSRSYEILDYCFVKGPSFENYPILTLFSVASLSSTSLLEFFSSWEVFVGLSSTTKASLVSSS